LRHGLSFARRSATRCSPDPFTTGPELRAPLVRRTRSGNAHGIWVPFAVFPGRGSPHFCGSSPLVVSRFAPRTDDPLIFTGGRSRAPSRLAEGVSKRDRPLRTARCQPTSGSCYRGQAERARHCRRIAFKQPAAFLARARQSCHGLRGLLSGVSDAVSAARHMSTRSPSSAKLKPQFAAALPFVGCHPLVGFSGD